MKLFFVIVFTLISFINLLCVTLPISMSNVTVCTGKICKVEFKTELSVLAGSGSSCVNFLLPDGTLKEYYLDLVGFNGRHALSFLYTAGDYEMHKIHSNCFCPDVFNTELILPPYCEGMDVCLRKSYYADAQYFGGNCIFHTGNTRNSYTFGLKAIPDVDVYKVVKSVSIPVGSVMQVNGTRVPMVFNQGTKVYDDGTLKVYYESSHKVMQDISGKIIVIDKRDVEKIFLIEESSINTVGFDLYKLGWIRYVRNEWITDNIKIEDNFHVSQSECSPESFLPILNVARSKNFLTEFFTLDRFIGSKDWVVSDSLDEYYSHLSLNKHVYRNKLALSTNQLKFIAFKIKDINLPVAMVDTVNFAKGCVFKYMVDNVLHTAVSLHYVAPNGNDYITSYPSVDKCIFSYYRETLNNYIAVPVTVTLYPVNSAQIHINVGSGVLTFIGNSLNVTSSTHLSVNIPSADPVRFILSGSSVFKHVSDKLKFDQNVYCKQYINNTVAISIDVSKNFDVLITSDEEFIFDNHYVFSSTNKVVLIPIQKDLKKNNYSVNVCHYDLCKRCYMNIDVIFDIYNPVKINVMNTIKDQYLSYISKFTIGHSYFDIYITIVIVVVVLFIIISLGMTVGTFVFKQYSTMKYVIIVLFFPLYSVYLLYRFLTMRKMKLKNN